MLWSRAQLRRCLPQEPASNATGSISARQRIRSAFGHGRCLEEDEPGPESTPRNVTLPVDFAFYDRKVDRNALAGRIYLSHRGRARFCAATFIEPASLTSFLCVTA